MFASASTASLDSLVSASGPPEDGASSHGKPHKVKKKKKKNKHKHKHKHKHEKHDKDKDRDTDVEKSRPLASSIILGHPLSSDASNANSPATHNAPSSPEVMWWPYKMCAAKFVAKHLKTHHRLLRQTNTY